MTTFDRNEYVRVADYYYRQGMTQDEIAKKMRTSRVRVNRILNRCRELGIVRINILGGAEEYFDLECKLEQLYGLDDVRLAEAYYTEDVYDAVGLLAADYLSKHIQDGDVVGLSRGRTLSHLMDNLPRLDKRDLTVAQLMGGWNYHRSATASNDIAHRFAERTEASVRYMYAPILVHNKKFKEAIWEEPSFLETYEIICQCRVAVVGVGYVTDAPDFLGADQEIRLAYQDLGNMGAVGEVCAHYFDEYGNSVTGHFDDKVIAVGLEDYRKIPIRIGVACGPAKSKAILGAVRGGYINVLITDVQTGYNLLSAAKDIGAVSFGREE